MEGHPIFIIIFVLFCKTKQARITYQEDFPRQLDSILPLV